MKSLLKISFVAALALGFMANAAEEIEIVKTYTPGSTPPIKVNISGFSGEVNEVLNFDLYVMGFINVAADQAQFLITGSNNGSVQGAVTDRAVLTVSTGAGSTTRVAGVTRLNKAYTGG